jgi:hypothetical protein
VQSFARAEVPEYEDWYFEWRENRNKVKRGVNFGISGNEAEFGISFSTVIPEGGGVATDHSEVVGLSELIQALEMSTQLHRAITRRAVGASELTGKE